jgi:hypothetical protein
MGMTDQLQETWAELIAEISTAATKLELHTRLG